MVKELNFSKNDLLTKAAYSENISNELEFRPFIYENTLIASLKLRQYWDDKFLQTDEFKTRVKFCLELNEPDKEWGMINAFWRIILRLEIYE